MVERVFKVEYRHEGLITFRRNYEEYKLPRNGNGYFAGTYPNGLTTIKGAPVSANVRVILRSTVDGYGDGTVVAKVKSAADGTWCVDNLPINLKYDVIARYAGENDVIMSDVSPAIM